MLKTGYDICLLPTTGFVTISALAADSVQDNIFKCGVAVAPVTNWIYYDTIYTERYMGLPTADDNLDGYRISDLTSQARRLKNKKLLLVHGTAGMQARQAVALKAKQTRYEKK